MDAPLNSEEEWLEILSHSSIWSPPCKPTIVIAPHPDDETLAAGGLIQHQLQSSTPVQVIAVTDGEAAYGPSATLGAIRTEEQERALSTLGLSSQQVIRLHLPDSAVAAHVDRLSELLTQFIDPGCLVVAPWTSDWHPDHEACGRAVQNICAARGAQLVFWLFWTWHRRPTTVLAGLPLLRLKLGADALRRKQLALHCHASQLHHATAQPVLNTAFLAPSTRPFETFIPYD